MSPLPERRKTPEELAALRQSLGIPVDGADSQPPEDRPAETPVEPVADLPEPSRTDEADTVPEPTATGKEEVSGEASSEAEAVETLVDDSGEEVVRVGAARPVRSLRKSAGLTVDQPKAQIARNDSAVIPVKRHSDEELNRIRKAAQITPAAADLLPKAAHPMTLVALYGVGSLILLAGLLGAVAGNMPVTDVPFEWLMVAVQRESFGMSLYGVLCGAAAAFLLSAGWLAWKRPLSRHHAGFMTIIAVLVLVFGTLYSFPQLHGA
ncbi:hypothetical protein [Haloferula rosea]|uniref:Uncharacterized protein n=1 Tax=Haloferula rosea TaxID=490093 RepID=A0A934VCV3_9BACT|nr:hypothetical protein [Haloferula rosea]MBK1828843.1 hypothetical protein [Haloferula rosea]